MTGRYSVAKGRYPLTAAGVFSFEALSLEDRRRFTAEHEARQREMSEIQELADRLGRPLAEVLEALDAWLGLE